MIDTDRLQSDVTNLAVKLTLLRHRVEQLEKPPAVPPVATIPPRPPGQSQGASSAPPEAGQVPDRTGTWWVDRDNPSRTFGPICESHADGRHWGRNSLHFEEADVVVGLVLPIPPRPTVPEGKRLTGEVRYPQDHERYISQLDGGVRLARETPPDRAWDGRRWIVEDIPGEQAKPAAGKDAPIPASAGECVTVTSVTIPAAEYEALLALEESARESQAGRYYHKSEAALIADIAAARKGTEL